MIIPAKLICPMCGKPADAKMKPFCSKRCADLDLSRWFKGSYAIPSVENDDDMEDGAPENNGKPEFGDIPEQ